MRGRFGTGGLGGLGGRDCWFWRERPGWCWILGPGVQQFGMDTGITCDALNACRSCWFESVDFASICECDLDCV